MSDDKEERLRAARPEVRWVFVEPDTRKTPSQLAPRPKKVQASASP